MKKRKVLYLLTLMGLLLGGCDFEFNPDDPAGSIKDFFVTQVWEPAKNFILGEKAPEKEEEKKQEEQQQQGSQEQQGQQGSGEQGSQQGGSSQGSGEQGGGGEQQQATVISIAVKENSVKIAFYVNDAFSVEGGKLIVSYSDNSTQEVDMTLDMVPVKPDMTQPNEHLKVDISYLGKTTSYYIKVVEVPAPTVAEIAIKTSPKVDYFVGDEFTVEGGVLQVTMSDSTRKIVNMTLDMIDNAPNMSEAHENYEVNVSYEGAHTSYVINVVAQDLREEVSIGISYEYNMGPVTEIVDFTQELVFTAGKEYKFHYGAYPNAAADSLGRKYLTRDGQVLDEKPTAVGEYTYKVELAEGDENYKPAVKTVDYKIVEPVVKEFLLNNTNAPALTSEAGEATQDVSGVTVNYKNAKAAEGALAVLVKQAEVGKVADANDNFIEIASPVAVTNALTVEFPAVINNYVRVYGSYDGEHFLLLDTLTRAKQTTTRANGYFYFRFVNSTLGESELKINSISFSYEDGGAPGSVLARSEYSDMLNGATYAEAGAFWPTEEAVYDANYSSKAIKFKNCEMHAHIEFGTEIKGHELGNYKVVFKALVSEDATYQASNSDATVKDNASVYGRLTSQGTKMGSNKKLNTMAPGAADPQWTTVEYNLADMYDDGESVDGINIWINRKCTTGFIYVDDFRLVQSSSYPRYATPSQVKVTGVTKTEYNVGDIFEFDGTVTVLFSDGYEAEVPVNDPNLTITEPDMSTSGTKDIVVSYTYEGVTRKFTYQISVTGANPKAEETQPIVAEANDLAKAANFLKESSSAAAQEETSVCYGDSTTSLAVHGLSGEDKGFYVVLPEALDTANHVSVKFFMKKNNYKFYLRLTVADYSSSNKIKSADAQSDPNSTKAHFTVTDAGNDWLMYEYTYDVASVVSGGKGVGRLSVRTTGSTFPAADENIIIDGLEMHIVD